MGSSKAGIAAALVLAACAFGAVAEQRAPSPVDSVVRIVGYGESGRQYYGSGVVVADGTVATNCHVTRKAVRVRVFHVADGFTASAQKVAADRDLCLLSVPGLRAPVARIGASRALEPGDSVLAVGFPGGRLSGHRGEVLALFEHHGGRTVQSTARFSHGASGGGLFDDSGALVGFLTFFRAADGHPPAYFAIPVEWVEFVMALESAGIAPIEHGIPFWALKIEQQPVYLRAAALEMAGMWNELLEVSRRWTTDDPFNPYAWRALAKAAELAGDAKLADAALQRSAALGSTVQ